MQPEDLNGAVEFDCPFSVDEDGNVSSALGVYAPTVTDHEDSTTPEIEGGGWDFVDGYSGQDRYSGPVMHQSEYLGGRMAQDVLSAPGIYVVCEVIDPDDMDSIIGWVLLKREGNS